MEDILNYIKCDKQSLTLAKKLSNCEYPIFLYGAGCLATCIIEYLKKYNIQISGIFVDREYFTSRSLDNIPIYDTEEVLKNFDSFYVVISQANYLQAKKNIEHYTQVKEIFFMTMPAYYQWNSIPITFLKKHKEVYNLAYEKLEDQHSKDCMIAYLNARVNDDATYVFNYTNHLSSYFQNDVICLSENEFYLDIGAYEGDAIDSFCNKTDSKYDRIVALEPSESFQYLKKRFANKNSIDFYHIGAWKKTQNIYFFEDYGEGSEITDIQIYENSKIVPAISIDELWEKHRYSNLSMVKINYCHGIKECLLGAKQIIKKYKPKFAIRVGFEELNVAQITNLLKEFVPEYKIYLRYCFQSPAGLLLLAI